MFVRPRKNGGVWVGVVFMEQGVDPDCQVSQHRVVEEIAQRQLHLEDFAHLRHHAGSHQRMPTQLEEAVPNPTRPTPRICCQISARPCSMGVRGGRKSPTAPRLLETGNDLRSTLPLGSMGKEIEYGKFGWKHEGRQPRF